MLLMETRAEHYRQRAKHLRRIAADLADADARATLLEAAADYDRMADSAEKLPSDKKPNSNSDGKDTARRLR